MNYWNESAECMERESRQSLQTRRLKETVDRIYHNVEHYRKKMQEIGLEPGDIKNIDDLHKLPFTTKQDLRDTYPFGLFAVPRDEIVRIHASSGTTGKSTVVGYTKKDIESWSECCARALVCAGAQKSSVVQVSFGYGLFTGGFGLHYGSEKIRATVVPASGGNTKKQLDIMRDFGTNILCCTPSYAIYLFEEYFKNGFERKDLQLQAGIFGAEMWTDAMRSRIESLMDIRATDIYGLSEITGPGVSFECECKQGLHVNEDYFVPEIVDPETGVVLPEGSVGELVFTTINKEGLPLLRYNTRDLSSLHYERCDCGRTLVRMDRISARSDDMIIIRGVNVFPSQVESALLSLSYASPHYLLVVDRQGALDTLEVQVEMTPEMFGDTVKTLFGVESQIKKSIEATLGISCTVKLMEPKAIARSEGKAMRVIDKRQLT